MSGMWSKIKGHPWPRCKTLQVLHCNVIKG